LTVNSEQRNASKGLQAFSGRFFAGNMGACIYPAYL